MRLLLTLVFTFISLFAVSQNAQIKDEKLNGLLPIDEQGKVTYQSVVQVDSTKKDELFKRARKWFTKTYNSSKDVLQINDPATGELSGKGYIFIQQTAMGVAHQTPLKHSITVEVKDARYRITVTDFIVEEPRLSPFPIEATPYTSRKFIDKFYQKTDDTITTLLSSLERAMKVRSNDF